MYAWCSARMPYNDPDPDIASARVDRITVLVTVFVIVIGALEFHWGRPWMGLLEFALAGLNLWAMHRRHENKRYYDEFRRQLDEQIRRMQDDL